MKYIIVDTIDSYIVARQISVKNEFDIIKKFKTYDEAKALSDRLNKKQC